MTDIREALRQCRDAGNAVADAFRSPNATANLHGKWVHLSNAINELHAAIAAADAVLAQPQETALERFKRCGADEESNPVERLRAFCSFAMNGQDWIDVEPFFDAVLAQPEPRVTADEWKALTEMASDEERRRMVLDAVRDRVEQTEPEPVAHLYLDSYQQLKLAQMMPPPVGAFPVYRRPTTVTLPPLPEPEVWGYDVPEPPLKREDGLFTVAQIRELYEETKRRLRAAGVEVTPE
jgi:hypothetical protein